MNVSDIMRRTKAEPSNSGGDSLNQTSLCLSTMMSAFLLPPSVEAASLSVFRITEWTEYQFSM